MTESRPLVLHPDRALPADPGVRAIARRLLAATEDLPIVSMHGHVDIAVFTADAPFPGPAETFIQPDHYLTRLLGSQGLTRDRLGLAHRGEAMPDPRRTWRLFCENWRLYRGTPTRYWLEEVFAGVFGLAEQPSAANADALYDQLAARLAEPGYRPLALLDRFAIETIATTDAAWDSLAGHTGLASRIGPGRVLPTFRPDALFRLAAPGWADALARLEEAVGHAVTSYAAFLDALRERRQAFVAAGARASDHAAESADTTPLEAADAERLFQAARAGSVTAEQQQAFVAHMLFESARMAADDGLTMQFHPGSLRDYDPAIAAEWGPDTGYDIPLTMDYTRGLRPLLTAFGHAPGFRLIVFTLDETVFSRELAPLAGVFPALRLGAPWWFLDSPRGMARFREAAVETAGYYNLSGFVDDTRAFFSIPARHNLARRIDAGHLAQLVAEHRLAEDEAAETAVDLAYSLPKTAYPPLS
jgi:glucuronate isomerase